MLTVPAVAVLVAAVLVVGLDGLIPFGLPLVGIGSILERGLVKLVSEAAVSSTPRVRGGADLGTW